MQTMKMVKHFETTKPFAKTATVDYVRKANRSSKFGEYPTMGVGLWANGWNMKA